jgi:hypothetical protein
MLDTTVADVARLEVLTPPKEGSLSRNRRGELVFDPGRDFVDMAPGETRTVNFDYLRSDDLKSTVGTATIIVRAKGLVPVVHGIEFADKRTVSRRIALDSLCPDDGHNSRCQIIRQPLSGKALLDAHGNLVFYPGHDFDDLMNGEVRVITLECEVIGPHSTRNCGVEFCITGGWNGVTMSDLTFKDRAG